MNPKRLQQAHSPRRTPGRAASLGEAELDKAEASASQFALKWGGAKIATVWDGIRLITMIIESGSQTRYRHLGG